MSIAPEVVPLAPGEVATAVHVLARAFRDNPLNRAVIRGGARRRERVNAAGLHAQLPNAQEHGSVLAVRSAEGRLAGVLVAELPFRRPPPAPPLRARLAAFVRQGPGVARRWAEIYDRMLEVEPPQPFFYLGLLGVDPELQGKGFGSALLARFLEGVDAEGARAVLETDRSRNVGFYVRAGFVSVRELTVMGVPVWVLARPPREPRAGD